MFKNRFLINFIVFSIISLVIYVSSAFYIQSEEKKQLNQKYTNISISMKNDIANLISEKKNATLAMAISISRNKNIINSLLSNNNSNLKFEEFSKELKENTKFKNVWFQIINKNGNSFYRSWTNKTDDSLVFRDNVNIVLKEKKNLATISIGKFDMTFKSMIPIIHNNEAIGVFEIITHFNSISKTLEKTKIDSIVLADEKYKDKIVYPFTKMFLEDYYIANLNAKPSLIDLIKKEGVKKILNEEKFLIIEDKLITTFKINEYKNQIGYVILVKNLNEIDFLDVKNFKRSSKLFVLLIIFFIGLLYTIISYYIYLNSIKKLNIELQNNFDEIKKQEEKNQIILDSQKNIIVITDGRIIKNSNKQLLDFFNFNSLDSFQNRYKCICETFIDMYDNTYIIDKDYDGKNWAEHILANPDIKFKAAILKDSKLYHFTLNVNSTIFDNETIPYIIVTLTDITHEIEQQEKLMRLNDSLEDLVELKTKELLELNESLEKRVEEETQKNKEKDRMLFQQSKMAAMGEMLSNIAHQWRQPLTSISTAISSLKLQKDLDLLDDKHFDLTCEMILKNSEYLSQTIEDFKNFFKKEKSKTNFSLLKSILENFSLLKDKFKHSQIELIVNIDKDIKIFGFKNEFQQAILNILNNSSDAFDSQDSNKRRVVLIEYIDNILYIKDSAGGIPEDIICRIFEPYFTTKHQSQGTGIGLYMTREILTKHMNYILEVNNCSFSLENEKFYGACFKINFI
ncbi:hypothetical protein CRV08_15470 [Halarcobacter ebronensis]|uniref:histidine kinase n=1 Tax=Halarcobacter ebronensis TaxID=1462615 RepID=A0A4Q0Y9F4_9BACT|nr:ATP-binding protein [Halarcobacter ebronensis]RXJ65351.1 hypothetical protein CRV08_15470 [Halarcobacter ebronensis]